MIVQNNPFGQQWWAASIVLFSVACGAAPDQQELTAEAVEPLTGEGVVHFNGSGTLTKWRTFVGSTITDGAPAALQEAFPIGAAFTASAAYDPAEVDVSFSSAPTNHFYRGFTGFTDLSIDSSGHTISPDAASLFGSSANQVLVTNEPNFDYLYVSADSLIDGSKDFAGYKVVFNNVGLWSFDSSALPSTDLPTSICFAHWQLIESSIGVVEGEAPNAVGYQLLGVGAPDRSIDSDGDGMSDGVELMHACIDGCAGDTDADGDTVLDRLEIGQGSDPCSTDTDGDGLGDGTDADPVVPLSTEELSAMTGDIAAALRELPPAEFDGPNAHAQAGHQGALANRLDAAADAIAAGDLAGALDILNDSLKWLDSDPSPPDVMPDGPAKDALRAEIEAQIALIEIALGG